MNDYLGPIALGALGLGYGATVLISQVRATRSRRVEPSDGSNSSRKDPAPKRYVPPCMDPRHPDSALFDPVGHPNFRDPLGRGRMIDVLA